MLIQYDTVSGKILAVTFGDDDNWTSPDIENFEYVTPTTTQHMVKIPDISNSAEKYYAYAAASPWIQDYQTFNISVDKTTIVADGQDYALFSNIPEGTAVWVDESISPLIIDATGEFEFSCEDVGSYAITFRKYGYDWGYFGVSSVWL